MEELPPGALAACYRCGSILTKHIVNSLARTAALSLAALIFYLPANLYPILQMELYGAHSESTVWDGCVALFQNGHYFVAAVVFTASMLVPLLKLLGLFYLVVSTKLKSPRRRLERTWIYKTIDVIGPWAMLDVFVLAVMVSLVELGQLATVLPGRGLLAFTAVAVLTILASSNFDPTLIWANADES
jgi:paraquat-inducible protein A